MPVRKQPFTILRDKMVQAIDVDDSRGRSVPINMNFIEEGFLSKDTGCELLGATEEVDVHSLFHYLKKDGTAYFLRVKGKYLQQENAGVWENLRGGTATVTIATPAVVSRTAHGFTAGMPVVFATTGDLPTGIVAGTTYYVIATGLTADAFQFSETVGGAAVNTSGTQSGTHTVHYAYADGARMGYYVYDNDLYFCNAVNNYTKWDGTTFTEYASAPKGNILEVFEDRMFVAGVTAEPLTVYYSNTGNVTTFTGTDILKPLGTDSVTGLVNYFGSLLIFKQESIWKLTFIFDQVVSLFIPKLEAQNRNYGACGRQAISWVENDVWFFNGREVRSIGFKDQQIGVLGVNSSVISETIKETLETIKVENYGKVTTFYYNRRFYLAVPLGNKANNETTFVCHLLHGNSWTRYDSRIKAKSQDFIEVDGVVYSAKSIAPYGILKWNDTLNDVDTAIPALVRFNRVEEQDFSRFNIYRYLDLMFKDLQARVQVTIYIDAHDSQRAIAKTFFVGNEVQDLNNTTGEIPVGQQLVANAFGEVFGNSPFIKKRVSFLAKAQSIVVELSNDKTTETFTIAQYALTGHKNPRKQFAPKNIISVV
jgi:hypothetical protein